MTEAMPNPWATNSGESSNDTRARPATSPGVEGVPASPGINVVQEVAGGDIKLHLGYTTKTIPLNDYVQNPIKVNCGVSCCPCCMGDPALCSPEHLADVKKLGFSFIAWISVIQIILFIVTLIAGGFEDPGRNPMLGPPAATLIDFGAKVSSLIKQGEVWRLFVPILLHAGIIHLVLNVMAQLFIGIPMESNIGVLALVAIYLVSGVLGNLLSAVGSTNGVGVGASGAILGLLGCQVAYLAVLWKAMQPRMRRRQLMSTLGFLIILFLIGTSGSVDNLAHFGGLVGGFLSGSFLFLPYAPMEGQLSTRLRWGSVSLLVLLYLILLLVLFL